MTYTCKLHQSRIHFFRTGFDFLYESSVPFDSFTWHGVLDSSPSFGVVVGRTGLIFFYDHNFGKYSARAETHGPTRVICLH